MTETIGRSRFITTLGHAADAASARAFIDEVRREYADATHSCWAYVAGPPGSSVQIGMSDAGEPHGTAGRPMLDVLLHSGIGEVVAVVTRYYGGVKLGKGGLVRAYSGSVQRALVSLPLHERTERVRLSLELGYADVDVVRRLFEEFDVDVGGESYADVVRYDVAVRVADVAEFHRVVADRTSGRARIGGSH